MEEAKTELSRRVKLIYARQSRGWTQSRLAYEIETSTLSVSRWEGGIMTPSLHFRQQLCRIFEMTEQELELTENTSSLNPIPQQVETSNHLLRNARLERGWSQEKLARMVDTDARTIGRWERNITTPTPYYRRKLCQVFGKSSQELGLGIQTKNILDEAADSAVETNSLNPAQHKPNELLQKARYEQGWSLEELAESVGVTYITVVRWERNTTRPSLYMCEKLCEVFDRSAEELGIAITEKDDSSPQIVGAVGSKLKAMRIERTLSQSYLATRIGASWRTISRWEHGQAFPSLFYQQRLCEFFGVDAEILGFAEDQVELIYIDQCAEDNKAVPNSKLSRQRKVRGWTQRDVAEKIDTYVMNVSRWERGEAIPDEAFQQKLCNLFQKTSEELGFTRS